MKKKFQKFLVYCFSFLAILSGLQVIFLGYVASPNMSTSIMEFNGFERLYGIVPILIGTGFSYIVYAGISKIDEEN